MLQKTNEIYIFLCTVVSTWYAMVSCMNYCITAVCHGGNQSAEMLKIQFCFDSVIQLLCIFEFAVFHFPLDNPP